MAINDILAQSGDGQDFVLEIPVGNSSYVPNDALLQSSGVLLCSEIPAVAGGSNIFVMSD